MDSHAPRLLTTYPNRRPEARAQRVKDTVYICKGIGKPMGMPLFASRGPGIPQSSPPRLGDIHSSASHVLQACRHTCVAGPVSSTIEGVRSVRPSLRWPKAPHSPHGAVCRSCRPAPMSALRELLCLPLHPHHWQPPWCAAKGVLFPYIRLEARVQKSIEGGEGCTEL